MNPTTVSHPSTAALSPSHVDALAAAGASASRHTVATSPAEDTAGTAEAGAAGAPAHAQEDIFALPFHRRLRRALRALRLLVRDPYDTQQVFELSSNINVGSIRRRMPQFYASEAGQRLFREDRSIDTRHVDFDALAKLPDGTLGREYVRFLADRGLSPDIFQAPENVFDPHASYVMKRMRQTHDLWHLVTNHATNPPGEVALQAFTYGQVGAPSSALIALAGTLRHRRSRRGLAREVLRAYRTGRDAAPLAAFAWEDHWATPLGELRQQLGITAVA
jgi:ubiquinone biosynthesis protein COQ4